MKIRTLVWILLSLASLAAACAPQRTQSPSNDQNIDSVLREYADAGQLSGAVLVARDSKVVYRGAFGLANRELAVPNAVTTRFRIGSVTKAFTAILVLQLVEQGRLRLDGAVTDYLQDYRGPDGNRITVRHLLTHAAGLRDLSDFPRNSNDFPPIVAKVNAGFADTDELVKLIGGYPLLFDPGTSFRYSNDGYVVLGAIIERVAGKPYEAVLAEYILGPAGMRNTGMAFPSRVTQARASGYDRTFEGYENAASVLVAANGGLYSTIDDLYLWWKALADDRLVSPASKVLMFEQTTNVTQFGWKVRPTAETMLVADGSLPGFTSLMIATDSGRQVVIQLTNTRELTHRLGEIYEAIAGSLEGKPNTPPRRSIAEALADDIPTLGIDPALAQAGQRAALPRWYESEPEINSLGYFLLGSRRQVEAVKVFSWIVERHPDSWNAYDSLGEASLAVGDAEAAVKYYRRSLELNPKNSNAAQVLDRMERR